MAKTWERQNVRLIGDTRSLPGDARTEVLRFVDEFSSDYSAANQSR